MNETSQPSVTEGLNVDQDTRPSERRTKSLLLVLAVLLALVGLARFFLVGNREDGSAAPVFDQSAVPAPVVPASAPRQGKDFGL